MLIEGAQGVLLMAENTDFVVQVQKVSMHFNMAADNINSIREYLTRLTRKKLFFEDFIAVDNVSFDVKKGEVFGIVGTNGSGKSTLLKMVAGVLTPTSGTVITKGKIAPLIELGAGFDAELTGRENIYLNGAVLGYSEDFINQQYDSIVEFSEIGEFINMPLKNYSSGMVSRIAFAIATAVEPDILIADEILSVGDYMFQEKCLKRIRGLMEKGMTVLFVSHSIDQIRSICNRAMWIEKGKQRIIGDVNEVCDAYAGMNHV